MKKVTYTVICPYKIDNKEHTFPIVIEVNDKAKGVQQSSLEKYCPFCNKYVRVTIDKALEPDTEVLRRLDFD